VTLEKYKELHWPVLTNTLKGKGFDAYFGKCFAVLRPITIANLQRGSPAPKETNTLRWKKKRSKSSHCIISTYQHCIICTNTGTYHWYIISHVPTLYHIMIKLLVLMKFIQIRKEKEFHWNFYRDYHQCCFKSETVIATTCDYLAGDNRSVPHWDNAWDAVAWVRDTSSHKWAL